MPTPASRVHFHARPARSVDDLDIERRILESRQRVYSQLRLEAQLETARLARQAPGGRPATAA